MITTSAELEEIIDSTVTIPTIPSTLQEITRVFAAEDGSAREAGSIIDKDPAIATKVLRLVNSSFYALRNPVSDIHLACSILGLKVIKNVVVQATVIDTFSSDTSVDGFDTEWLWDHSFKTAMAARLIADRAPAHVGLDKEDAYTCGLVHDIGKMMLLDSQPQMFGEALEFSRAHGIPLAKAEEELFGFSHAHVGGLLARRWKLADHLQAAIAYHHSPGGSAEEWSQGFFIYCANSIAHEVARGDGGYIGHRADVDSMTLLGLTDEQLDEIRTEVRGASLRG